MVQACMRLDRCKACKIRENKKCLKDAEQNREVCFLIRRGKTCKIRENKKRLKDAEQNKVYKCQTTKGIEKNKSRRMRHEQEDMKNMCKNDYI